MTENPGRVLPFVKPKTDVEQASEIKEQLIPLLQQICAEMDKANALNFQVSFNLLKDGQTGANIIVNFAIMKQF